MLNLSKFASNVLSSIDNAAKESREEPKQLSAAQIRSERKQKSKVEDESEYPSAAGNEGEQVHLRQTLWKIVRHLLAKITMHFTNIRLEMKAYVAQQIPSLRILQRSWEPR